MRSIEPYGQMCHCNKPVPRGTEIVAHAFFAAVEEIPDNRRDNVIKAALVLIREKLSGRFQGSIPGARTSR